MTRNLIAALTLLLLGSTVLSACARTAPSSSPSSSPEVEHVAPPTGEKATDRASILAALDQVRPGGTIQFAPGTYLVGELIRVEVPRITLLGHPDGTTLRGCDPAEFVERAFVLNHCNGLELVGGYQTVRNLTFEYGWHSLIIGCCFRNWLGSRTGGYLIEGNTFRHSVNGIRVVGQWPEPAVIRGNTFINLYHAATVHGSTAHILDNEISVPEPERVPFSGHPGGALFIVPNAPRPGPFDESLALTCAKNVIAGNSVDGHVDGIGIGFDQPRATCRENVIRDNTIRVQRVFSRERDAIWMGVPLSLLNEAEEGVLADNLIEDNRIIGAEGIGMEIVRASRNRIVNNTITGVVMRDSLPGFAPDSPQDWRKANGSGIWVSRGSEENEIVGNTFTDIAAHAIVLEGDRNRVETRSASDAVRDLGRGNRVTGLVGVATRHAASRSVDGVQTTGVENELKAIVEEFRGDNDRFGVLFARFDGDGAAIHVSGDVRPNDHLRLGSTSKVFLSFIFLREGPGPDATIEAFYPSERYPHADAITARKLLNHTSGVPDEMGRKLREFGPVADPAELLRALQPILAAPAPHPDERIDSIYNHELGLDFAPGTTWCYSNPGYLMLGRMLERSTGQPMQSLLARHFGEVAPSLYLDDGREARFPASYPSPWPIHWSQPWVAGALIATAADAVAALHHIAQQPEFARMQEWMTAPRCPVDIVFGDDYGLGLQRYAFEGIGEGIGHDGHIIARSLLFLLDGNSYLVHTTGTVGNAELRVITQRLLAAQR